MVFIAVDQSPDLPFEEGRETSFETDQTIDTHPKYPVGPIDSLDFSNMRISDLELRNESDIRLGRMYRERNDSMVNLTTDISVCVENWHWIPGNFKSGRMYYSVFSLVVQYILPFITISILHAMVFRELKKLGKRRSQIIIQIENAETTNEIEVQEDIEEEISEVDTDETPDIIDPIENEN
jgi:hypothetical protein